MATSSSTDPARGLRPRRPALIAAAVALAFAVAAVGAVLAPRPGADDATATPRFRAADRSFSVALPAGWRADTARTLRTVPSAPAAVLRRADRRGLVVIRRRPALRRSGRPLARDLTAQLGRRFRGLRPVGARTVRLASGRPFSPRLPSYMSSTHLLASVNSPRRCMTARLMSRSFSPSP